MPMFQVLVSDGHDRLGQVVLRFSENGSTTVTSSSDDSGAPGEAMPFSSTCHTLANHICVRSPPRLRFEILGRSSLVVTLRRDDADGSPIWMWRADGAEHAARDLPTAIREVLIWLARNADRPLTGDLPRAI